MAEFKFVQWGKGVPLDYQRLNAMMLNEQYLKDIIDPSPRGVLGAKTSSTTFSYSGAAGDANPEVSMGNFTNIGFNCAANRMIRISFFANQLNNSVNANSNNVYLSLSIDSGASISLATFWLSSSSFGTPAQFTYLSTTALTEGTHTATVRAQAYDSFTMAGSQKLIIEDIGSWFTTT